MRSVGDGKYHLLNNNCQHFVDRLWLKICTHSYQVVKADRADLPFEDPSCEIDEEHLMKWLHKIMAQVTTSV
jgi:hypothetical protein